MKKRSLLIFALLLALLLFVGCAQTKDASVSTDGGANTAADALLEALQTQGFATEKLVEEPAMYEEEFPNVTAVTVLMGTKETQVGETGRYGSVDARVIFLEFLGEEDAGAVFDLYVSEIEGDYQEVAYENGRKVIYKEAYSYGVTVEVMTVTQTGTTVVVTWENILYEEVESGESLPEYDFEINDMLISLGY